GRGLQSGSAPAESQHFSLMIVPQYGVKTRLIFKFGPALLALLFLSAIWAYAVLRSGGVSAQDWRPCVLALASLAIICTLSLCVAEHMTPLGPFLKWLLILLPCYVALQVIPMPLIVVRLLSPARAV